MELSSDFELSRPKVAHIGGALQHPLSYWEGRKEMFYLTTHSPHFIYGNVASDIQ